LNFSGIASDVDTQGQHAAGATQFVQWVSNVFAIFNQADGAIVPGPSPGNSIGPNLGGPFQTNTSG
jgi:hypothetical protein